MSLTYPFDSIEGIGVRSIERLEAFNHSFGVLGEARCVGSFAFAQFDIFAVGFDGDSVDIACRGRSSGLVVEGLGLLIHGV